MTKKPARNTTQRAKSAPPAAEEAKKPNQAEAEAFAAWFKAHGFNPTCSPSAAWGGQPQKHLWAVNVHDPETGFGVIAGFFGYRQFHAFIEFKGTKHEGAQVGKAFSVFMAAQRFLDELKDQSQPEEGKQDGQT